MRFSDLEFPFARYPQRELPLFRNFSLNQTQFSALPLAGAESYFVFLLLAALLFFFSYGLRYHRFITVGNNHPSGLHAI